MHQVEQFNRHMMTLARESRGVTQSELAKRLGYGQGTISKYESGTNPAPDEFVSELSSALEYKKGIFYETGRPYGMPPFHYRKRKKLGAKALNKIVAEINLKRIHVKILLRSFEIDRRNRIPEIDRDEYIGPSKKPFSVEFVAEHVRDYWGLGERPIENVIEIIEEHGGIVIPCRFDTDLIDAVSQRVDGLPVLFFANMNSPADRIRHTLCHELGHMVLHTTSLLDDEIMEAEADMFANAFLLPARIFRSQVAKFDLRQVANMKKYWKVSMSAIAMRAHRLNLITDYQKKSFFIEMGKRGYRKSEPYEPQKESPRLLDRMIDYHLNVLRYSHTQLAESLYLSCEEFRETYVTSTSETTSTERPSLRIVK